MELTPSSMLGSFNWYVTPSEITLNFMCSHIILKRIDRGWFGTNGQRLNTHQGNEDSSLPASVSPVQPGSPADVEADNLSDENARHLFLSSSEAALGKMTNAMLIRLNQVNVQNPGVDYQTQRKSFLVASLLKAVSLTVDQIYN